MYNRETLQAPDLGTEDSLGLGLPSKLTFADLASSTNSIGCHWSSVGALRIANILSFRIPDGSMDINNTTFGANRT